MYNFYTNFLTYRRFSPQYSLGSTFGKILVRIDRNVSEKAKKKTNFGTPMLSTLNFLVNVALHTLRDLARRLTGDFASSFLPSLFNVYEPILCGRVCIL